MEYLALLDNNFSGGVPFDLGRKMKNLFFLILGQNNLGYGDASDLSFIDSLTNCSKLQTFDFSANSFGGVLPTSIANLSSHLKLLVAGRNQLVGSIPAGIFNFINLDTLGFERNLFSGVIPFEIGQLRKLELVSFRKNKLSGPIPESIGNLTRIFGLDLAENNFSGTIPSSVLPLELGKLNNLQELDVSENKLSGHIPSTLGNCLKLEGLFLEGNMFQGSIPLTFSSLKGIESLDLSRNNLSGQIPKDLVALVLLKNLNLSFNNLAGEVPLHGVFGNLKYGIGGRTSIEGDVYSYGILLLEMLTGKRPTDELFTIRQSLHEFCKEALPERVMEIVDSRMLLVEPTDAENDAQKERFRRDKTRECSVSLVRIGIACSAESPSERMNIKDVIIGLMKIKEVFLGIGDNQALSKPWSRTASSKLRRPRSEIIGIPLREQHSSSTFTSTIATKLMTLILSSLLIYRIKLVSFLLFFTTATQAACRLSNETDRLALLSFKELIAEDPLSSLSSWNSSLDLCKWDGVTCSRKHQRVVVLDLKGKNLRGTMSPFLGNLSFLKSLYLPENRFQGKIPLELSRLFRLQHLNLSSNSLQGEMPTNLSNSLRIIVLKQNNIGGKIPASFGSLSKLIDLRLYSNNLIGGIPPFLSNLSLLQKVDLGRNSFTGTIPHSIGRLGNLKAFGIGSTKLSGTVPPTLYNISTLMELVIPNNQLTGSLPQDIGLRLPNLILFSIAINQFWGPVPASLSNASRMEYLALFDNNFLGGVPFDLGRKMKNLFYLNLGANNLGSGDASDLSFIDSLTNCSKLQTFDFAANGFGGVLPTSIANLSSLLNLLAAGRNQLVGSIPAGIFNFINLDILGLEGNLFSGVIPFEIGKLKNLQVLVFSGNKLSGPIPTSIGNLTQIFELDLDDNNLNGTVPSSIVNILGLQTLDLSHNFLTGPIPQTVGLFSTLTFMYLAHNAFIGVLPLEIGKLNNLQELDVSENKLSGQIPSTLGNCFKLEGLFLEGNTFQGSIPPSFSSLKGIESLDLSRNNLSGQIPKNLAALKFLKNLNLSFNNLAGEVPLQEYGTGGRTSTNGDVYSFGILLLEMLTGKRPTDEMFTIRQSLHEFCKVALPERVMEIVDPRILLEEATEAEKDTQKERIRQAKIRECLVALIRIGIECSEESPRKRMNVKDVIIGLTTVKEVFLEVGIHGRRQMRMRLTGEGTSRE
ncbi:hypothetical protein RHSIM_Rhsim09G0174700 [Rhododendron simsii]|uniref:non-specific serine/threonine protein kinase n=1 Tax=Rhododendron simsii TaxID=118357 RepID=A0A834GEY7_RHOSS|nr:hypothetical protein RHSIM_Rhsim09G0174700 [Rhododendron simsii]